MSVKGIRVVRGPDWNYGKTDGGDGHVGTVTKDNEDDTVEVQWDMGQRHTCRTGKGGKFDLLLLDSSPSGLKQVHVTCYECKKGDFFGTRWKCLVCYDYDLCTPCYFLDKHKLQHQFTRIDAPGLPGETVAKRSISNKMRSLGIYVGATVKRGADWEFGNQDGGAGNFGDVISTKSFGTGDEINGVNVKWANNYSNCYRVGYQGKVDIVCVEETPGMDYYRDHLFVLSTKRLPKKGSIIREESFMVSGAKATGQLKSGDKVCVYLDESALMEVQRGHGGWNKNMSDCIGQNGIIKKVEDKSDVTVMFDGMEWRLNRAALIKVPELNVGDVVRVNDNKEKVKVMQRKHGGWSSDMTEVLGKVGKIVKIDSDGDVAVVFGPKAVVLNPACCSPATGTQTEKLDDDICSGSEEAFDLYDVPGGVHARGQEEDTESISDDVVDSLAQMMAQLFVLGGAATAAVAGSQEILSAAAKGEASIVRKLLQARPELVNAKFKGLTPLIIASHEGNQEVVEVLTKNNANLDLKEEKGNTALMAALMKKRESIALHLIERGANIHLLNCQDRNALHAAAFNEANTALKVLIEKGCSPNQVDEQGDTPIHDAITAKNNSGVAFLCAAPNINLKICNKKGLSPLHLAAMKDDELSASKILAKQPELISKSGSDGHTALHVAAINENIDVAKLLIRLKAPIDMKNSQGLTPLHLACHQAHLAMSQLLLENSASMTVTDNDGDTPLHVCMMGRRNSVSPGNQLFALMLGLKLTDENEVKERFEVACLLIKNGANVNARNKRGMVPLQCCSNDSLRNAVRQFIQKQSPRTGQEGVRNFLGDLLSALTNICSVCSQRQAKVTFLPCRHKACCENCCFRVRSCPLCDRMILERIGEEHQHATAAIQQSKSFQNCRISMAISSQEAVEASMMNTYFTDKRDTAGSLVPQLNMLNGDK